MKKAVNTKKLKKPNTIIYVRSTPELRKFIMHVSKKSKKSVSEIMNQAITLISKSKPVNKRILYKQAS